MTNNRREVLRRYYERHRNKILEYQKSTKDRKSEYDRRRRDIKKEELKLQRLKYASDPANKIKKSEYDRRRRIMKALEIRAYDQERKKHWRPFNRELLSHYATLYRSAKLRATPPWLTDEQLDQIRKFYLNRPVGHHVDHVIPLRGKKVWGLHVPWNLQYLPAQMNFEKSNKCPENINKL